MSARSLRRSGSPPVNVTITRAQILQLAREVLPHRERHVGLAAPGVVAMPAVEGTAVGDRQRTEKSRRAAAASGWVNCPTIRSKAALGYGGKLVFTTKRSPKGMTFSFAK